MLLDVIVRMMLMCVHAVIFSGQSKGECGGTAFPHLLFSDCIVPRPEFKG